MTSAQDIARILKTTPAVIPTETVFGLAAPLTHEGATHLRTLKNRQEKKPFAVLVSHIQEAQRLIHIPQHAHTALKHLWPGPLTFIGEAKDKLIAEIIQSPTIGIRVSPHPIIKTILSTIKAPLVLTSANISGSLSITHCAQLDPELKHLPCLSHSNFIGLESTVLRLTDTTWHVLRLGATTLESLARFYPVHYTHTPATTPWCYMDQKPESGEHFIGFGSVTRPHAPNLSPKGSVTQACQNLYATLHAMRHANRLHIAPLPNNGLGLSVRDTLQRLVAPRDGLEPPTK